jgi:hypothetical protein
MDERDIRWKSDKMGDHKGPEGKSKLAKDKRLKIKPQDSSPRDPRESSNRLLSKKKRDP